MGGVQVIAKSNVQRSMRPTLGYVGPGNAVAGGAGRVLVHQNAHFRNLGVVEGPANDSEQPADFVDLAVTLRLVHNSKGGQDVLSGKTATQGVYRFTGLAIVSCKQIGIPFQDAVRTERKRCTGSKIVSGIFLLSRSEFEASEVGILTGDKDKQPNTVIIDKTSPIFRRVNGRAHTRSVGHCL